MKRKRVLTPLHKQPRGHQPLRDSLVLRDKRQRRAKDRLRRELGGLAAWARGRWERAENPFRVSNPRYCKKT